MQINTESQKQLLKLSRQTLESYFSSGQGLHIPQIPQNPQLGQKCGVFVTLKENGQLRGCIGRMESKEPLCQTVQKMSIAAAIEDPRFPPLQYNELKNTRIEISVLSPLKKIKDVDEIQMGKHGVLVKKDWQSGVFLPQVATETGWDKATFLSQLCSQKANLPSDAWQTGEVEIFIFTCQLFSEKYLFFCHP